MVQFWAIYLFVLAYLPLMQAQGNRFIQAFAPHPSKAEVFSPSLKPISLVSPKFVSFNSSAPIATISHISVSSFNLSDARFRRSPECLISWKSRETASNGTVVEAFPDLVTIEVTEARTSTVRLSPLILVTGPTTQVLNLGTLSRTLRSDDVCCGLCNVYFPKVQVLYWPVESNNTWCLKHNFTTVDSPVELPPTAIYPDPDTIAPPKIFPAPKLTGAYQNLPVLGNVIDPDSPFVNLNSFIESKASPSTSLLPLSPSITADSQVYAVGTDGFTFISPSVYIIFSSISAINKCGPVGNIYTSLTLSFPEGKLSTVEPILGETKVFNFADLPCPSQAWGNIPSPLEGNEAALSLFAQNYHPEILAPLQVFKGLDPAWSTCAIINLGNGYDPPRTLVPASNLVIPTPIHHDPTPLRTAKPKLISKHPSPESTLNQLPIPQPTALTKSPKKPFVSNIIHSPTPLEDHSDDHSEKHESENATKMDPAHDVQVSPTPPPETGPETGPERAPNPLLSSPQPSPFAKPNDPKPNDPKPNDPKPNVVSEEDIAPTLLRLHNEEKPSLSPITIGSSTFTANSNSKFLIGTKTLAPGGPPITIEDVPYSLGASAAQLVVGSHAIVLNSPESGQQRSALPTIAIEEDSFTRDSASRYHIGTQTLIPGGSAITVNDVPYSIDPAATILIAAEHTVDLDPSNNNVPDFKPLILTIGSKPYTANSASQYIIGTQTLAPGGPAITISGVPYLLAPSATALISGTQKIPLTQDASRALPTIIVAGNTYRANGASQYIINSQTLSPGGPPITIGGVPYSLAPAATALISNHVTLQLSSPQTRNPAIITIDSTLYTANSASDFIINEQTLAPGSAITLHGTKISLGPQATDIVIGSSTESIGLGGLILSGFGGGGGSMPTATQTTTTGELVGFTGGAQRGRRFRWGVWAMVAVLVGVWNFY